MNGCRSQLNSLSKWTMADSEASVCTGCVKLEGYFQPVVVLMKLLGIFPLDKQSRVGFTRILYSLLLLSITVLSNAASLTYMISKSIDPQRSPIDSDTVNLTIILDNLNFTLMAIGSHLTLLYKTRLRWGSLHASLQENLSYSLHTGNSLKLRKFFLAITGLVYIPVNHYK